MASFFDSKLHYTETGPAGDCRSQRKQPPAFASGSKDYGVSIAETLSRPSEAGQLPPPRLLTVSNMSSMVQRLLQQLGTGDPDVHQMMVIQVHEHRGSFTRCFIWSSRRIANDLSAF